MSPILLSCSLSVWWGVLWEKDYLSVQVTCVSGIFYSWVSGSFVETGRCWWPHRCWLKYCVLCLWGVCISACFHPHPVYCSLFLLWGLNKLCLFWLFSTCERQNLSAHLDLSLAHPRQRPGKSLWGLIFPFYWDGLSALQRLWAAFCSFLLGFYLYLFADFPF